MTRRGIGSEGLRFRGADLDDAGAIAQLHADSWKRHYRGAYSDAFLDDGDILENRMAVWSRRLSEPSMDTHTIVAERAGEMVAFVHTVLGADEVWGALIDNLHVRHTLKRRGVGSRLLSLAARAVADRSPSSGLYLWVLEQNSAAQAFYEARGGVCVGREKVPPPGDDPATLNGSPIGLRYAWRDLLKLRDPHMR